MFDRVTRIDVKEHSTFIFSLIISALIWLNCAHWVTRGPGQMKTSETRDALPHSRLSASPKLIKWAEGVGGLWIDVEGLNDRWEFHPSTMGQLPASQRRPPKRHKNPLTIYTYLYPERWTCARDRLIDSLQTRSDFMKSDPQKGTTKRLERKLLTSLKDSVPHPLLRIELILDHSLLNSKYRKDFIRLKFNNSTTTTIVWNFMYST